MDSTVHLAGGALAFQTVVLAWVAVAPATVPAAARPATLTLSLVAAAGLYRAIRDREPDSRASWWRPDWRLWVVGMLFPAVNLGAWVAYALRTWEVDENDRPTGRWKYPVVAGAATSAIGTAAVRAAAADGTSGTVWGIVGLLALAIVGFTVVAAYYDTRYVKQVVEASGSGWLFNGFHWVIILSVLIPTNLVLSAVYLYRRRMLLRRAACESRTLDELASGETVDEEPPSPEATPDDDIPEDSGPE